MAAWIWDSCNGVNISLGYGIEGTKHLSFCAEELRRGVKEELFGV